MFAGEFTHTIDSKGMIIIPAKYREALGLKCVMAKGQDGAVNIYTMERWNEFEEKFKQMPQSNPKVRRYIRDFYGNAQEVEPDSNGRVTIPQKLKDIGELKKEVVTIGAYDHLELWDAEKYRSYVDNPEFSEEEMLEVMEEFGL